MAVIIIYKKNTKRFGLLYLKKNVYLCIWYSQIINKYLQYNIYDNKRHSI